MSNFLPTQWKEVPLAQLLGASSFFSDGDWVESRDQDAEGRNRLIQLADVGDGRFLDKSNRFLNDEQFARLRCTALVEGDILIARMPDPIGRACVFPAMAMRCATVVDVAILRNANAHPGWLIAAINSDSFRRKIEISSCGTTRTRISRSFLTELSLLVPPQAVQRRIADVLCCTDTAIKKTEDLIAKYQQIKAGLMHDLFTRGVLPNGQLRPTRSETPELYQETAVGWIPREWQYELLDNLASRGSGHTPNKDHPEYWNGGIKWVSLADSYRLDQLYISDTDLEISLKGIQNSSAVLHPAGIVVLSRDAGVGKSAITTEPMAVSQHFMCWKCDQKMDNHFLYYWLQFNKRTFENIAMGSTILTIGLPYFKRLRIACPVDLGEQSAIANRLKSIDSRLVSLQNDLSKMQCQKLGLMQDLLTGKVPVQVDAPEAAHA